MLDGCIDKGRAIGEGNQREGYVAQVVNLDERIGLVQEKREGEEEEDLELEPMLNKNLPDPGRRRCRSLCAVRRNVPVGGCLEQGGVGEGTPVIALRRMVEEKAEGDTAETGRRWRQVAGREIHYLSCGPRRHKD